MPDCQWPSEYCVIFMLTQAAASRGKQQINCRIRLLPVETLLSVKRFVTLSTWISVKFSIYVVLWGVFQLLRWNLYVIVASGIKGWGRRGICHCGQWHKGVGQTRAVAPRRSRQGGAKEPDQKYFMTNNHKSEFDIHCESKKTRHYNIVHNFAKCWPIFNFSHWQIH